MSEECRDESCDLQFVRHTHSTETVDVTAAFPASSSRCSPDPRSV